MIPKARGVPESFFRVMPPISTLKETEDICLALDERFTIAFSHVRLPLPLPCGHRKGLEDKIYPAMDLLVHGEFDGASCIVVEDCIRML